MLMSLQACCPRSHRISAAVRARSGWVLLPSQLPTRYPGLFSQVLRPVFTLHCRLRWPHTVFRLTGGDARCPILAGLACGTVFGVPLGLMVADWASWRWTFGLIVGVGLCAMLGIGLLGRGRIANVETPAAGARFATLGKGSNVVTMLVTLCTGIASLGLYTYFIPLRFPPDRGGLAATRRPGRASRWSARN